MKHYMRRDVQSEPGTSRVEYCGHQEAVQVPFNGRYFRFERGVPARVPKPLAESLLRQEDKFKEVTT